MSTQTETAPAVVQKRLVMSVNCKHVTPDGGTALRVCGGFIYEELECELCGEKFSELEFQSGPAGAGSNDYPGMPGRGYHDRA